MRAARPDVHQELFAGRHLRVLDVAKLIVWLAPVLLIISRALEHSPVEYLALVRFRQGAAVGFVVGAVVVAMMASLRQ